MVANLLIIHQGALGDFILTFPAIKRLQKYYNSIDVLCQSGLGKLAKGLGIAENWYPAEAAYVASLFSDQIHPKMKAILRQYENIILFSLSDQLARSIGRVNTGLKCRLPPKPPADQRVHVTKFVLDSIYNCGLIKITDVRLDNIPLAERTERQRIHQKILLHPGAGSTRKRWPAENFLRLESMLKMDGLRPEFVLGPAEHDLAEKLHHHDRRLHILDDLLDLLDLLDSAGGYIGNDSGASHLAAYRGLPAAVIFGPADPERWKPVGRAVIIVRPGLGCEPCFETAPENCDERMCLEGTSPRKVMDAFYSVYER